MPSCAICLCEFKNDTSVTYLNNCLHVFCRDCIAGWFFQKGSNSCPICKQICLEEDVIKEFTYENLVVGERVFLGENLDAQDAEESSTDSEEVELVQSRLQQDIEEGAERVLVGAYWRRVVREIEALEDGRVPVKKSFESDGEKEAYWRGVSEDFDFYSMALEKRRVALVCPVINKEDMAYWEDSRKEIEEYEAEVRREEKWQKLLLRDNSTLVPGRKRRDTA